MKQPEKRIDNFLFPLLLLVMLGACGEARQTSTGKIVNEADTLARYERFRTVFYSDSSGFNFYKDSLNRRKFAIFSWDSARIRLYQFIDKRWMLTDSVVPALRIDKIDYKQLNNDQHPDIVVQRQAIPNNRNIVFIFNTETDKFEHRSDYDMSHVNYYNMTLTSKEYYDTLKHHWEQTSYQFSKAGKKIPYRSYELFSSALKPFGRVDFFQYNKGQKTMIRSDSGKVEGIWYRGRAWIETLGRDYFLWSEENLK